MAGIGFELRKLTRRDDLLGIVQGYTHSALAATGPWLITIISLSAVVLFGSSVLSAEELSTFRLIIIYNFAFSLVMTGPVVMIATRFLADSLYARDVQEAPGMLLGSLIVVVASQIVIVAPFYLLYVNLDGTTRLVAIANFFLISGVWLASAFLTALKDYNAVTGTFATGMVLSMLSTPLLARADSSAGTLIGFSSGIAFIFFALMARVFAEYPYKVAHPFEFRGYYRKYWELAASGLVYNLGIWIDKWVMWSAPESITLKSRMVSYPDYDSAMFLAYLTIVPSMAAFLLAVETDFFDQYVQFYRDIQQHATYERIQANQKEIILSILRGGRTFVILQGSICLVTILAAPQIFGLLNINFRQLGMFRIGVLGAFFHILFLGLSILISYFDLRRAALGIQTLFLVLNGGFTYMFISWGFPYYGYGYFLATLAAFIASFVVLARFIGNLPYETFVANNTSVE